MSRCRQHCRASEAPPPNAVGLVLLNVLILNMSGDGALTHPLGSPERHLVKWEVNQMSQKRHQQTDSIFCSQMKQVSQQSTGWMKMSGGACVFFMPSLQQIEKQPNTSSREQGGKSRVQTKKFLARIVEAYLSGEKSWINRKESWRGPSFAKDKDEGGKEITRIPSKKISECTTLTLSVTQPQSHGSTSNRCELNQQREWALWFATVGNKSTATATATTGGKN